MQRVIDKPLVMHCASQIGLVDQLAKANDQLENVGQRLRLYLETKRSMFPRFRFLSDDEMLSFLASSSQPNWHTSTSTTSYITKCFENIHKLSFEIRGMVAMAPSISSEEATRRMRAKAVRQQTSTVTGMVQRPPDAAPEPTDIVAMRSIEGEEVPFRVSVRLKQSLEKWLYGVEEQMLTTLPALLLEGVIDYKRKECLTEPARRSKWLISGVTAQIAHLVSQIYMAVRVEECLTLARTDKGKSLESFLKLNAAYLTELAAQVQIGLTAIERGISIATVTHDVHNRDVIDSLLQEKIKSTSDFAWQRFLRLRYDLVDGGSEEHQLTVHQGQMSFKYGFEYLGVPTGLVVTPLTDRCFLALTTALQLRLSGALMGPAGTGKTETVKDLSKSFGLPCIVFNCSDSLELGVISRFFAGIVQLGCWSCFDEFNRIEAAVLSVIASQIMAIQSALRAGLDSFMLDGSAVEPRISAGIFVTMNPDYKDRTELPENLKALFRPMAMIVPDYIYIAEVLLFSAGFEKAQELSRKITKLFELSTQRLSAQSHYDFGMRALKLLLRIAADLRATSKSEEALRMVFNAIDVDGGGTLDKMEIRTAFREMKKPEREIKRLLDRMQANKQRELTFEEFRVMAFASCDCEGACACEEKTLIQSMRQSNAPKLIPADISLFETLTSDLFPKIITNLPDRQVCCVPNPPICSLYPLLT
jgi:dynein heavy chain